MAAATCVHFEGLPFAQIAPENTEHPLLVRLRRRLEKERVCQMCSKPTKSNYLCLNPDCFFIGCGREDKRHAVEHYNTRQKLDPARHSVVLNTLAGQCWCYDCDDVIAPPIFAALEIADLATPPPSRRKPPPPRASLAQPSIGVVGLYNLGNSCYMNAAIQALLNCPSVFGFLNQCSAFVYRQSHRRITESLVKLVESILLSTLPVVSPSKLVREVKLVNPMFHGYSQQDAMDFVRCIFERVHEEMRTSNAHRHRSDTHQANNHHHHHHHQANNNHHQANNNHHGQNNRSEDAGQRRRSERLARIDPRRASVAKPATQNHRFHSIISDTFGGVLRSEIDCLECRNISLKDDPFFDLGVQICASPEGTKPQKSSSFSYFGNLFTSLTESIGMNGKPVRLETCLAAFCAPESLDGRDKYRCEKCQDFVSSRKTLRFKELPPVLCIQLKRFRHESYFSSKINTHVIFPLDTPLDMLPFLHQAASPATRRNSRYQLLAVISHRGTFSGGHYVSYCRHQSTGQWFEFDDSVVTVVTEEDVAKVQAYALFYGLLDAESRKEREECALIISESTAAAAAAASIGSSSSSSSRMGEESTVYISRQWYNRWNTLATPGPMDNAEISCHHSRLPPEKLIDPLDLLQAVPQSAYDYLLLRHGEVSGLPPLRVPAVCDICLEEEREIEARRRREEKDVQALDTSTIGAGEMWYLISSDWLVQWSQFKSGGATIPGPISNDQLMLTDTEPRPNLIRGTHYRGINQKVWDYFYRIYGGGPSITRKSINIYAPPPEPALPDGGTDPPADDLYVDVVGH